MAYRYKPKVPKSQAPPQIPFVEYYPHTIPKSERNWSGDYYQTVSIDPAKNHYGIRIERSYRHGATIPIVYDKQNIDGEPEKGSEDPVNKTYDNLTNLLNKYKKYYEDCHYIIIERQLPFNYKIVRIEQHTVSYFGFICSNQKTLPSILCVDSQLKGKMLGAPKGLNENQTKQWSVEKAIEILKIRGDTFSLEVLEKTKKKDDLADIITQKVALFRKLELLEYEEAFFRHAGYLTDAS